MSVVTNYTYKNSSNNVVDIGTAFCDLTNAQTIAGAKVFTNDIGTYTNVTCGVSYYITGTGGNKYAGYLRTFNGNTLKMNSPGGCYFNIINAGDTTENYNIAINGSGLNISGNYAYNYSTNTKAPYMAFYLPGNNPAATAGYYYVTTGGVDSVFASVVINGGTRILMASGGELDITSDARLKENIISIDHTRAFNAIKNIRPVVFNFIERPTILEVGFIAQETEKFIPESITFDRQHIPNIASYGSVTQISETSYKILLEKRFDTSDITLPVRAKIDSRKNIDTAKHSDRGKKLIEDYNITEINIVEDKQCLTVELRDDYDGDKESVELLDKVFVIGIYVDDCRTLNKNAIFTFAVAALQKLISDVEVLTLENAQLKTEIQTMKSELFELRQLIDNIILSKN